MKKRNKKLFPALLLFTGFTLMVFSGCGEEPPPVESITLVPEKFIFFDIGEKKQLIATVLPENANTNIIWTSSNESAATVDNNGLVTAVNWGQSTITAKAGEKSATCEVRVQTTPYIPEYSQVICLKPSETDLIDVYSATSSADQYVDSVFKANVLLIREFDYFINNTLIGDGFIIWTELPLLIRTYKTGQYAGRCFWTLKSTYIAEDTLPTSRDECFAYGTDPNIWDEVPFLRGSINLAAINSGGTVEDNISGATMYFFIRENEQDDVDFYPYGIITEQTFTIDGYGNNTYFLSRYNFTRQMFFWLEKESPGEYVYMDFFCNTIVKNEYEGNVILVTLDPLVCGTFISAPAKPVRTKIVPAQLKKMRTTKFDNIDWSKAKVLSKNYFENNKLIIE